MRSNSVDGFVLAYEDVPADAPDAGAAVLLHGWPGDRGDYGEVVALLRGRMRMIVPDLRGFGGSDKHDLNPAEFYSAAAQARSLIGLVEDLGTGPVVMAGYDIGSRIAQAVARTRPDLVRALILAPPLPGIGKRILTPNAQHEFWYQSFHQLALCEQLIADEISARTYLAHFWNHWSGPGFVLDGSHLDRLAYSYSAPGAFRASIAWYRAGAGSIATSADESPPPAEERIQPSTTVLWPSHDPLFPRAWSDRLDQYFCDFVIRPVSGAGHFAPLEYPQLVADAIADTS